MIIFLCVEDLAEGPLEGLQCLSNNRTLEEIKNLKAGAYKSIQDLGDLK